MFPVHILESCSSFILILSSNFSSQAPSFVLQHHTHLLHSNLGLVFHAVSLPTTTTYTFLVSVRVTCSANLILCHEAHQFAVFCTALFSLLGHNIFLNNLLSLRSSAALCRSLHTVLYLAGLHGMRPACCTPK